MNEAVLKALRSLRNEIAHGQQRLDSKALAKRLQDFGISITTDDLQWFVADLMRGFGRSAGEYFVPPVLIDFVSCLLEDRTARIACDPWAGLGVLAAKVHEAVRAEKTLANNPNEYNSGLARLLASQLEWHTSSPLDFIEGLTEPLDVIATILPFGLRTKEEVELKDTRGETFILSGELGPIILAAASMRLSPEGVGLFVVSPSLFTGKSVLHDLPRLGLGIEAALALPAGSFAPFTNIPTYLLVVRKRLFSLMFVAQLSQDSQTNRQIVTNMRERRVDGALELGRLLDPVEFSGVESLQYEEQFRQAEKRFKVPAASLRDLSQAIHLGRPGADFKFPKTQNAIYIPLIGISDVVESIEDMTLKPQNYAQVVVNASRSDVRFVARFLNSELGRATREANKSGMTIPKLNTSGLKDLRVLIPTIETQRKIIEIETRLEAEYNTILGLKNDLDSLRRDLWSNPDSLKEIESRLKVFSGRFTVDTSAQATLEQWIDTLPFPLASILRAWQATSSEDNKKKYEHLLDFFEAVAEFIGVVFLSAYSSQREYYAAHRTKLIEAWKKQNLSLERATFGTWKVAVEYFAKQTRDLLNGNPEKRQLCMELFSDPDLNLPKMLSRKELTAILSEGNKMRNDWRGHGGIVSPNEAKQRNEKLLFEVQKLRDVMEDCWQKVQLIRPIDCKPRNGVFYNEFAILMSSNNEFLKKTRPMSSWLDIDRLYILSLYFGHALLLQPLIRLGASPPSAKNAFYFFNRVDKEEVRFVSYHYEESAKLQNHFEDTASAINFLSQDPASSVQPGE